MKIDHSALEAFLVVAREKSFTRAAAHLGVSQSALSHTVRRLEEVMGLRLLSRTTRSVAPTQAGERLLAGLAPKFDEIEAEIAAVSAMRERPSGTIRITTGEHAANTVLWPRMGKFLKANPDINLEIITDQSLTDIVAERFDAGVRFGGQVAKDMVAVRIGPDVRFLVVAAPALLKGRVAPKHPRDLLEFPCINLRLPTYGGLYAWEFEKGKQEIRQRVEGRLVLNNLGHVVSAAIDGFGFAYVPESMVSTFLARGRLVTVLDDWTAPFAGYHLYYPSRRQHSIAFAKIVEALRWHV